MQLKKKKKIDLELELTFEDLHEFLMEKLKDENDEDINIKDADTLKLETVERGLHSPRLILRKGVKKTLKVIWE